LDLFTSRNTPFLFLLHTGQRSEVRGQPPPPPLIISPCFPAEGELVLHWEEQEERTDSTRGSRYIFRPLPRDHVHNLTPPPPPPPTHTHLNFRLIHFGDFLHFPELRADPSRGRWVPDDVEQRWRRSCSLGGGGGSIVRSPDSGRFPAFSSGRRSRPAGRRSSGTPAGSCPSGRWRRRTGRPPCPSR